MKFLLAAVCLSFMLMLTHNANDPPYQNHDSITCQTNTSTIATQVNASTLAPDANLHLSGEVEHALLMAYMALPERAEFISDEAVPNSDSIPVDNLLTTYVDLNSSMSDKMVMVRRFAVTRSTTVLLC